MNEGKVVVGGVLLGLALYAYTSLPSDAARIGGVMLGIPGLIYLIIGLFGK